MLRQRAASVQILRFYSSNNHVLLCTQAGFSVPFLDQSESSATVTRSEILEIQRTLKVHTVSKGAIDMILH